MRHPRHGDPRRVLAAALEALGAVGHEVLAASPVVSSEPLGPSRRRYANAAAIISSAMGPDALLDSLQTIERSFGRRRRGQQWGARVLDLDIVLWSQGAWSSGRLLVPHPQFRRRRFVLGPAAAIAPSWIDPVTALTVRQFHARLTRANPVH
ncbi:2-amino-4-hydroxy-6-hydroxymethyldihydropteridine diphosphokinase [Tsuneonella deserti]|nr:2-amino-4-hydroxy-6-hydroxymethyldihydropteridine diphosphokinase [Tsuneonella deserti]